MQLTIIKFYNMINFKTHPKQLIFILLFIFLAHSARKTVSPRPLQTTIIKSQIYPQLNGTSIQKIKLQQINEFIDSKLQNCQNQPSSGLLYDCQIQKEDYPQFIYDFFSQRLLKELLHNYQQKNKKIIQHNQQQVDQFQSQTRDMLHQVYWDFVQIFRPNKKVTVQDIYDDFFSHDVKILDLVQHFPNQYESLISVLKYRARKQIKKPRQYETVKDKSAQGSKQAQANIFLKYFGECTQQQNCRIPIKAYPFYLRDMFFFSTPQSGRVQKGFLSVRSEFDYEVTQYFIKQVGKLSQILGNQVEYSQRNVHFHELSEKLKQLLGKNQLKSYLSRKENQTGTENSFTQQL